MKTKQESEVAARAIIERWAKSGYTHIYRYDPTGRNIAYPCGGRTEAPVAVECDAEISSMTAIEWVANSIRQGFNYEGIGVQ